MSKIQENIGKRLRATKGSSLAAAEKVDSAADFPMRDIDKLFCSSVTINCALQTGCIPCAYKVCCFDVALDSKFCTLVKNQRPEQCPRANSSSNNSKANTCDLRGGETLGYKGGVRVLTVGDGDFSFSLAVARLLSSKQARTTSRSSDGLKPSVVATSYESRDTLGKVYPDFEKTASELESLGAMLCFKVDATRLADTLPSTVAKSMKFHRIVWNFPCTAIREGQDGQNSAMDHNKQLVREFVENSRRFVVPGGELHLCHKTKPPFNQWRIEEVAVELCESNTVLYRGRIVLDKNLLPPYQPRKALHSKSFPCHDACFYIFKVSGRKKTTTEADSATLPDTIVEYEFSSEKIGPVLYPVSHKLIHSIRDKLLAKAATKQNKQRIGGKFKKQRKR